MKSAEWSLHRFRPGDGTRIYTFGRWIVGQDRESREVEVDLMLAREHGVLLQELPALCRWMVESGRIADRSRLQVTTADLEAYLDRSAAVATPKPSEETGAARLMARFAQIVAKPA